MNKNIELPVSVWLKQLMVKEDVSGYELSRKTGIEQSQIQRIVSGETKRPLWSTVEPLARYFGENVQLRDGVIKREFTDGGIIITDPEEIELILTYRNASEIERGYLRVTAVGIKQNSRVAKKTGSK